MDAALRSKLVSLIRLHRWGVEVLTSIESVT